MGAGSGWPAEVSESLFLTSQHQYHRPEQHLRISRNSWKTVICASVNRPTMEGCALAGGENDASSLNKSFRDSHTRLFWKVDLRWGGDVASRAPSTTSLTNLTYVGSQSWTAVGHWTIGGGSWGCRGHRIDRISQPSRRRDEGDAAAGPGLLRVGTAVG